MREEGEQGLVKAVAATAILAEAQIGTTHVHTSESSKAGLAALTILLGSPLLQPLQDVSFMKWRAQGLEKGPQLAA